MNGFLRALAQHQHAAPPSGGLAAPPPITPVDHTGLIVFQSLLHLLVWVLLLLTVWLVTRMILRRPRPLASAPRRPALDELDMLYARGEVTRDDYLSRRTDLIQ